MWSSETELDAKPKKPNILNHVDQETTEKKVLRAGSVFVIHLAARGKGLAQFHGA